MMSDLAATENTAEGSLANLSAMGRSLQAEMRSLLQTYAVGWWVPLGGLEADLEGLQQLEEEVWQFAETLDGLLGLEHELNQGWGTQIAGQMPGSVQGSVHDSSQTKSQASPVFRPPTPDQHSVSAALLFSRSESSLPPHREMSFSSLSHSFSEIGSGALPEPFSEHRLPDARLDSEQRQSVGEPSSERFFSERPNSERPNAEEAEDLSLPVPSVSAGPTTFRGLQELAATLQPIAQTSLKVVNAAIAQGTAQSFAPTATPDDGRLPTRQQGRTPPAIAPSTPPPHPLIQNLVDAVEPLVHPSATADFPSESSQANGWVSATAGLTASAAAAWQSTGAPSQIWHPAQPTAAFSGAWTTEQTEDFEQDQIPQDVNASVHAFGRRAAPPSRAIPPPSSSLFESNPDLVPMVLSDPPLSDHNLDAIMEAIALKVQQDYQQFYGN